MTNGPKAFTAEELSELAHFKIRALAESLVFSEGYFVFPNTTVTVCLLTTHHGHYEIGSSYFPDVDHFTPELGRFGAREDAMTKLQPIADYLFRENQFKDGAVLESIPVALPSPQEVIALGSRPIDVPTAPMSPPGASARNREASAIALAKLNEGMKEITEAGIALAELNEESLVQALIDARRYMDDAALYESNPMLIHHEREAKIKTEIADTAAGLLHGGLITPEEHDKITGPDYGEQARERDSQVSGDGVELLSVQHPSSASDLSTGGGSE